MRDGGGSCQERCSRLWRTLREVCDDEGVEKTSVPRTARQRARAEITGEIIAAARRQLAAEGAPSLSLRAVARDLGMVSSAVYRYVSSRDDLLTLLIVDAYDALGEAVELAEGRVGRGRLAARFAAACRAVREWALANPNEYALIYGSPVPGYVAPESTIGPASRVSAVLLQVLLDAVAADLLTPAADGDAIAPAAASALVPLRAVVPPELPPALLQRALLVWTALFGTVSFELFGQLHNVVAETPAARAAFFDECVRRWTAIVGIAVPAAPARRGQAGRTGR
jgi:AcrR family transcriptional regulator